MRPLLAITSFSIGLTFLWPSVRAAETEYSSQPTTLLELEVAVRANPRRAAATVTQFLDAGPSDSASFVGQSVAATMRGLGSLVKRVAVGRVMLAVVKARPAAVLEVVRVAVPLSRKDLHPEIVAASASGIAAVSDLYLPILVKLVDSGALGFEPYESRGSASAVQVVAGMTFAKGATLAEDIVQVAFQSASHGNLAALSRSANAVLLNQGSPDPFTTLGQVPQRPVEITAEPLATPVPVSP
jgi:hypothetical protein